MEHTLGGAHPMIEHEVFEVLILVLVEHTLGGRCVLSSMLMSRVLILVLVEHTLGEQINILPQWRRS